ncbi:uncharacterized protein LOC135370174 isoform X2 [Ornithodoros turicata]|uniref:uncharacterized protein LOC135370174 isoform X2 n=1 Tax=Ornithodoros turicata TaxID=34597 RepID=UPI0031388C42
MAGKSAPAKSPPNPSAKSPVKSPTKAPAKPPARNATSRELLAYAGYIIGREIGEGTYSKVRMAVKNGMTYAVKIVPKHLAPREYVTHFLPRELDIIPKLQHPNIVQVFDILDVRQKVFIVMEMATKGDLLQKVSNEAPFSEGKAFLYFEQIADAVAYLHKQHIVHRDLKCENILLNPNHQVKLADFSFTRYCYNPKSGRKLLSETYCGSAAYAAPEVIQNIRYRPKRYDSWSLGVILYIMVAGQLPFDDSDPFHQVRAQMCRQIYFPPSYRLSKLLKNLIRHLLEPVVLYRSTVTRALKHPWMRRERIKRKLRDIKRKSFPQGVHKQPGVQHLRDTQSCQSFSTMPSPVSSLDTVGPKSVSASALPKGNNGASSPKAKRTKGPDYYSKLAQDTGYEDKKLPGSSPPRALSPKRGKRSVMSPTRFGGQQNEERFLNDPAYRRMDQRMMQLEQMSPASNAVPGSPGLNACMSPDPMYPGCQRTSGPKYPRQPMQSPTRGLEGGPFMHDSGFVVHGRLPRRHRSQGELASFKVATPYGQVFVSSSSSGEYY